MNYFLCVEHINAGGRGTACCEPFRVSLDELGAIKADVFRWMDGAGIGPRLNDLRPNRVVVTDANDGVLFSAYRK